jgi:hypothetical protein
MVAPPHAQPRWRAIQGVGKTAMLSRELGCLFVHIPKNGGTSIEDAIWGDRKFRTAEQFWKNPALNKHQREGLQHLTAPQLRLEIGHEAFADLFKFSFIRNPWDRAVSQYAYTKKSRPDLRRILGLTRFMSFRSYLTAVQRAADHPQWRPQHLFIEDQAGELLVDYVGRFERIAEDFAVIAARIGLTGTPLPHSNRSARKADYRDYYTAHTRSMVSSIYEADIERFKYLF